MKHFAEDVCVNMSGTLIFVAVRLYGIPVKS
jgi:hypothetical protein